MLNYSCFIVCLLLTTIKLLPLLSVSVSLFFLSLLLVFVSAVFCISLFLFVIIDDY